MIDVLLILLTAFLSFLGGWALWQLKRDRLELVYEIDEFGPFPLANQLGKSMVYHLYNKGNRPIENISLEMQLVSAELESVVYSDQKLIHEVKSEKEAILCKIPLLNPRESIKISITLKAVNSNSTVDFQARAIGVSAMSLSEYDNQVEQFQEFFKELQPYMPQVLFGSILGVVVIAVVALIFSNNDNESSEQENYKQKYIELVKYINDTRAENGSVLPQTPQIIFVTMNKYGLGRLFPDLLKMSGDSLSYWKTGFYLMNSYIANKKDYKKYVQALLSLSEVDYISESSKGTLLYLAAKIEQNEGNQVEAEKYLSLCKTSAPKVCEYLISGDYNFELDNLSNK